MRFSEPALQEWLLLAPTHLHPALHDLISLAAAGADAQGGRSPRLSAEYRRDSVDLDTLFRALESAWSDATR